MEGIDTISNDIQTMNINNHTTTAFDDLLNTFIYRGVSEFREQMKNIFSEFTKEQLENMLSNILCAKFSRYRNEDLDDIIDMFLSRGIRITSFLHPATMTMKDLEYLEQKGITTREKFDAFLTGCKCYACAMTLDEELNKYIKFDP